MEDQIIDPYRPLRSSRVGAPPLVIRVTVTKNQDHVQGGMPQAAVSSEAYVLLSALPEELRQRVVTAVQTLAAGQ